MPGPLYENLPELTKLLTMLVERVSAHDASGYSLEQRVEARLDKLEGKIDRALTIIGEVSVLQSQVLSLQASNKEMEKNVSENAKAIEGLKTWRSVLSSLLGLVTAPLAAIAVGRLWN